MHEPSTDSEVASFTMPQHITVSRRPQVCCPPLVSFVSPM